MKSEGAEARAALREVLAFWERGRLFFNAALLIWTAALLVWRFEAPPTLLEYLRFLALVFLLFNLAYCAAYPVELALRTYGRVSASVRWRWGLWAAGTLAAAYALWRLVSGA